MKSSQLELIGCFVPMFMYNTSKAQTGKQASEQADQRCIEAFMTFNYLRHDNMEEEVFAQVVQFMQSAFTFKNTRCRVCVCRCDEKQQLPNGFPQHWSRAFLKKHRIQREKFKWRKEIRLCFRFVYTNIFSAPPTTT